MTTNTPNLSRSDRAGMYLTIVIGVLGAIVTLWFTIARLIQVAPNRNVPVLVPFTGETASLPIGPDGTLVSTQIEEATVVVPHPAAATYVALIAEPIVVGLTILALITLLCVFCWKLARGQAFQRSMTRITIAAAFTVLGGWAIGSLFTTMTVNGALSAVSDYSYDGVIFSTNFAPVFAALALGAIGAAFHIAERLRRETDGLI